jgi:DegV family protein with EDD domain
MRSIMDAIVPTDNPKQTAVALADAAIIGARGNSGIIFAQFLYGFSNEIKTEQNLDIKSFAESIKNAVAYAYDAIANPVEGTILTVIKDWAEYIYAFKDIIDDFIRLLIEAYQKAQESLAETTSKLEVLARSHVVDAGAKGFVVWLEGILDFFTKDDPKRALAFANTAVLDEIDTSAVSHDVITFRYCSEALINGTNLDKTAILNAIRHCGDSHVIAGSHQKMRIHIHTDFPAELFSILQRFGNITYQKVDDMVFQNEVRYNRKSDIAILTDSTCDLPKEIMDRYQIHFVPLTIHFGETFFLDRVTIQPEHFHSMLENTDQTPTSAQPAFKEFQNKYEYLGTQYESVIGINLSAGLSGTCSNSEKAAKDVSERTGKQMKAINSKTISGSLGLIIMRAAEAIENGVTYPEVLSKIEEWIQKSTVRISVKTLKYIVKSGRVSPLKSFIANLLDIKPLIAFDKNGSTVLFSKSFTEKSSMKKAIRSIEKLARTKKIWNYAITHSDNLATAEWYSSEMERITGLKPAFVEHVSPVLVAHAGPGVACVAILFE